MRGELTPASEPRRFSQIAEALGLSIADVAALARVGEATVSRLWSDPAWLDRVSGRTLQALIAAIPGVAEYAVTYPQCARQAEIVANLRAEGLAVDTDVLADLTEGGPQLYVTHALEAALHVVRGNLRQATVFLPRLWGRRQDGAMAALFRGSGGLFADPRPLIDAAADLVTRLAGGSGYSFHAILAHSQLAHHVARASGHGSGAGAGAGDHFDRQGALALRSSTMGALASAADPEPARAYHALVCHSPLVRLVEEWAFPCWTRDWRPGADMAVPQSILLRRTAAEVLREVDSYGDGYLYYLVTTYVPLALERDPTFGLRAGELRERLLRRREVVSDPAIRQAIEKTALRLPTGAIL